MKKLYSCAVENNVHVHVYLSALTATVSIMANEPLLNVYIFQNKWQKYYFLHFFCFPYCTENVPNRDPKTEVHTEPWILCTVTPLTITYCYQEQWSIR